MKGRCSLFDHGLYVDGLKTGFRWPRFMQSYLWQLCETLVDSCILSMLRVISCRRGEDTANFVLDYRARRLDIGFCKEFGVNVCGGSLVN